MRTRIGSATCAALLVLGVPASAAPPSPVGRWLTEGDSAIIQIAPCGAALCGAIDTVLKRDPKAVKTDVNNPDPRRRQRPTGNLTVLSGFVPEGARWRGQVYDPRSGWTYKSFIQVRPDGTLALSGCVWMLCQTQSWRRAR